MLYTAIMYWSFAILNGRLAEVFFDTLKGGKPKVHSHGYVKRTEYKTRHEKKMIDDDTKKNRLSYRKGKYRRLT